MPLTTITWAIARNDIEDSTAWRVLVVMADHADESGLCWPKCATIAEASARSDRQVREHLSWLVDAGYLDRVRIRRGGRLGGYLYRVLASGSRAVEPDDLPRWAADTELPERWTRPVNRQPTTGSPPPDATGSPPPVDQRRPTAGQEVPSSEPPSDEQKFVTSTAVAVDGDDDADIFPGVATADTIEAAHDLCRRFALMVRDNGHALPVQGSSARDSWLTEMERLIRIGPPGDVDWTDNLTEAEAHIHDVMSWALTVSDFWPANIRSVPKFRSQFTTLRAQMNRRRTSGNGTPTGDEYRAAAARLRQMEGAGR